MNDQDVGNDAGRTQWLKKALSDFTKELRPKVILWTASACLSLLALAAIGWGLYIKQMIDDYIIKKAGGVPAGAVIALDDPGGCEKLGNSWEPTDFAGRFIIGADRNRTEFNNGQKRGGNMQVVLSEINMPKVYVQYADKQAAGQAFGFNSVSGIGFRQPTDHFFAGGLEKPQAIDVTPPYVALHFCREKA
jgi:hypothetical protein